MYPFWPRCSTSRLWIWMTGKKGRREESSHKGGEEGEISHKERNGGRDFFRMIVLAWSFPVIIVDELLKVLTFSLLSLFSLPLPLSSVWRTKSIVCRSTNERKCFGSKEERELSKKAEREGPRGAFACALTRAWRLLKHYRYMFFLLLFCRERRSKNVN